MTNRARKSRANRTSDALVILEQMTSKSERSQAMLRRERLNVAVAREVYDARSAAGLSQRELAKLVGTSHSVINRLEDADYQGHSLTMLRRIAEALDRRLEVRFVPNRAA